MNIICATCGRPGGLLALSGPCLDCARSRQRAAMDGRCHCPRALCRPRDIVTRIRSWIGCDRCLGTIRQTS